MYTPNQAATAFHAAGSLAQRGLCDVSLGKVCLFVTVSLVAVASLSASPVGSVSGTVKDSSGAIVPAVRLTLTNTAPTPSSPPPRIRKASFSFCNWRRRLTLWLPRAPGFKKVDRLLGPGAGGPGHARRA